MDFVPLSEIDRLKQLRCRVHEVIAITVDETLSLQLCKLLKKYVHSENCEFLDVSMMNKAVWNSKHTTKDLTTDCLFLNSYETDFLQGLPKNKDIFFSQSL